MGSSSADQAGVPPATPQRRHHHIIIIPFLAPGHMIPVVPLAARLASFPATTVTLASTPLNATRLATSLPPSSPVRVQALPFHPPEHGLPDGAENLDSIPDELHVRFFRAIRFLGPHVCHLLADIQREALPGSRLTVLSDPAFCWTVDIARKYGACHALLQTSGAYALVAYRAAGEHMPELRIRGTRDDEEFGLPGIPERFRFRLDELPEKLRYNEEWIALLRDRARFNPPTDVHLINTVEELEHEGLRLYRDKYKDVPVWPIGPLHLLADTSSSEQQRGGTKTGVSGTACVAWLDAQPPASVLYASFGSEYNVNASQMLALATALESSSVAFLWVVRPPVEFARQEFRDEWLPPGFEARVNTTKQGLLVRGWAPQLEILSHPSVGAFLSHCGWNSTLEGLSNGIPMLGWPMAADQYFNAKMLVEELGVCVVVARGTQEAVSAEKIKDIVTGVVDRDKSKEMRRKAAGLAEIVRAATLEEVKENGEWNKGSSLQALDDFINFALQG